MGLEVFAKATPDIIIVDICIPELDGLGFIFAINKISSDIPVIAISGVGEKRISSSCYVLAQPILLKNQFLISVF